MAAAHGKGKTRSTAAKESKPASTAGTVILYNVDENAPRGAAVRGVLAQFPVAVRTANEADLGCTVGSIAGLRGFPAHAPAHEGSVPSCEFMLMSGLSPALLTQVVDAMRAADCSIGCKATVTQYNRFWPFAKLIEAVAAEHEALSKQG